MNSSEQVKKLLILIGSPRRNGNSATLAAAVKKGAEQAKIVPTVRFVDDYLSSFLRDCRSCRQPGGECSIEDRFRSLFFEDFLPAHGVVICSPVYWYGLSAQIKAFLDRSFCYYAASFPDNEQVMKMMSRKRIALALSSEETYPGASLGITLQIQEFSRYTHSEFVGVVRGIGNSQGEVGRDPEAPLESAKKLGRELFVRKYSDYRLDTARDGRVWP